jgi:hypothetical protein
VDSYECRVTVRMVIEAADRAEADRVAAAVVAEMASGLPESLHSRLVMSGPRAGTVDEPTCRFMGTPLPPAAADIAQQYAEAHVAILWAQAPRHDGDGWEVGVEAVEVADEAGLRMLEEANFGALLEAQAAPGGFFSYID